MIEVKAIIGLTTQRGENVSRRYLEEKVAEWFVGATVNYGRGLWEGKWEDNATVTVACEIREATAIVNRLIDIGHELDQQAAYINNDGLVTIVEC